jgi:crotonobetainyl-CoA:carnitine CoA-transferase CaiB-like acyl-CoA transferase
MNGQKADAAGRHREKGFHRFRENEGDGCAQSSTENREEPAVSRHSTLLSLQNGVLPCAAIRRAVRVEIAIAHPTVRPPPLEGVLVLDLSRVLAGPYCSMVLADLGARVIKVEQPGSGDTTRGWGPPFDHSGESAYYLSINRNKESIVLDLGTEAGRRSVEILADRADVLLENFAPGALDRLGLSLADLRLANPRLVTGSVTGFGRVGPDRDAVGFDLLAQAGAGLMWVTGDPEGPPQKVGMAVSDVIAGYNLAIGVLAALVERDRTGRAEAVDVDLFSSTLAMLPNYTQACLVSGVEARRFGTGHGQIVPYQMFRAKDRDFILAVGTERQFRNLCDRVIARPAWRDDARYSTNAARVANRGALIPELSRIFGGEDRDVWLEKCRAAGVPAGPVRGPLEALGSPQAEALGLVRSTGEFRTVASPVRFAGSEPPLRHPPKLGEQTEKIKKEFGLP